MKASSTRDFFTERDEMVQSQLAARGVRDSRVLEAFYSVPRERFVPDHLARHAYEDAPLPIGGDQTISQPYVVALMAEALQLKPGDRVLEVGTGSGYAAAILSKIAAQVYTVERLASLADSARKRLEALGCHNVHVLQGDGTLGWPEHAPYDAIIVAAGGPSVPETLRSQLAVGGRLVMPVGQHSCAQRLIRLRRLSETKYEKEDLRDVRFVPLIGAEGWDEPEWEVP